MTPVPQGPYFTARFLNIFVDYPLGSMKVSNKLWTNWNEHLMQLHLPSYLILEWPGEGPLFQLELKNAGANMWALFESSPGPLFMSTSLGHLAR